MLEVVSAARTVFEQYDDRNRIITCYVLIILHRGYL